MVAVPVPTRPQERLIVYIDGFNLYNGLHDEFGRSLLWLDVVQLVQSLRPQQKLVAVKYFTAPVLNEPEAQARQAHYIRALETLYPDTFHVIQGRYQTKSVKCRKCKNEYVKYEEKETDVNIAVSLVADTARHDMDSAIIISADSDLTPAIRAARSLSAHLFIVAAFPPRRYSSEIKKLLPESFQIGKSKFRKYQMDEKFTSSGQTFKRPTKWFNPSQDL